jgi:DNA invertase Pin-like site-specific DNA recombinase
MTKPRAALYLRQSTYREESISLELQETACRTYAEQQGYDIVAVESDPGISGRKWDNRPGVQKVMGLLEGKDADVIVLWKWSRLSRSRLHWAVAADKVETLGGRIESATEPVDVSTSTGRFTRGMLTEMAAFESERIGDSWKETQARRVKNGLPHSGRARFGYTYSREEGFQPDPVTGPVLRRMYLDFLAGTGFWKLSHESKAHGGPIVATGVRRMMDAGFAAGYITQRGEFIKGAQEALITEDEWKAYKVVRKQRAQRPRAERGGHVYSGIVRCECGCTMTGNHFTDRKGNATSRYNCSAPQAGGDHTNAIVTSRLDEAVLDFLRGVASTVNAKAANMQSTAKPLSRIDARPKINADLSKNAARIDALTMKYLDGDVTKEVHDRLMAKLHAEQTELQDRLDSLEVKLQTPPPTALAADLVTHWDQMPPEVKRGILGDLVDRIEVSREGGGRWNPKEIRVIPAWDA